MEVRRLGQPGRSFLLGCLAPQPMAGHLSLRRVRAESCVQCHGRPGAIRGDPGVRSGSAVHPVGGHPLQRQRVERQRHGPELRSGGDQGSADRLGRESRPHFRGFVRVGTAVRRAGVGSRKDSPRQPVGTVSRNRLHFVHDTRESKLAGLSGGHCRPGNDTESIAGECRAVRIHRAQLYSAADGLRQLGHLVSTGLSQLGRACRSG